MLHQAVSRSSSSDLLTSTGASSHRSSDVSTSGIGSSNYGLKKYQVVESFPNTEQQIQGSQTKQNKKGKQLDYQEKDRSNNETYMEEEFANPVCFVCKNRRPKIGSKRDFSYIDLYTATQGFSAKNFLSEGGFGSVYKGKLDGMTIAVKQHKRASFQGEKEFKSEVNVLGKARHENVVMLLGSCSEGNNRLLVYEYVCNGSLDQHLSGKHTITSFID